MAVVDSHDVSIQSATKPYTAKSKEMWAWGIGGVANHALIATFGQVTNLFILGFGLSPILVSWVMTIPRLFDGLIDPFIGHLSDNTHTRWGRRKPFLLAGSILAAIFLAAIWWVNKSWAPWVQFVYLLTCCTAFYCCWGAYAMAWTAIGYELTDDYHERSRVQGIAGLFMTIVLLVVGWIYWLSLRPMFSDDLGKPYEQTGIKWIGEFVVRQVTGDETVRANEINGIRWIAGILAVVAVIAALICMINTTERFTNVNARKKHTKLLPAIKETMKNRPFVILLLQRSCNILGGRICGGVASFLSVYYVCGGSKELSFKIAAIIGTYQTICGLALMPLMGRISRKIGKRKAVIIGTAAMLAAAVVAPITMLPGQPYLLLLPALIFTPITLVGNTLSDALLPDICDYDELQWGERREGLFTAVMAFFSKLEMSASALGVGYLIAWTGYNHQAAAQTDAVLNRMWWLTMAPNIVFSLLSLLLILKFPMTESTMNDVRQKIEARRSAKETAEVHEPAL